MVVICGGVGDVVLLAFPAWLPEACCEEWGDPRPQAPARWHRWRGFARGENGERSDRNGNKIDEKISENEGKTDQNRAKMRPGVPPNGPNINKILKSEPKMTQDSIFHKFYVDLCWFWPHFGAIFAHFLLFLDAFFGLVFLSLRGAILMTFGAHFRDFFELGGALDCKTRFFGIYGFIEVKTMISLVGGSSRSSKLWLFCDYFRYRFSGAFFRAF